ncbi:MAG: shikimate kinase [Ilumatobacteraceae bacterium]
MSASLTIVLVGLMGSGKTTVGKRVARLLNCEFVDLDDVVRKSHGASIREIFSQHGEEVFRDYESAALASTLTDRKSSLVLATGGGAVIRQSNREIITESADHVVWLDAHVDELVHRTQSHSGRPLLDGDPRAVLSDLMDARRAWYESVATMKVETQNHTESQVAETIVAAVGPRVEL